MSFRGRKYLIVAHIQWFGAVTYSWADTCVWGDLDVTSLLNCEPHCVPVIYTYQIVYLMLTILAEALEHKFSNYSWAILASKYGLLRCASPFVLEA